ncbi:RAQPRD family integrative conjugative element protein [Cardiobacterium hominis]|uniref:RAQPRD family integrative conjugative element protein n=1 Tax=Cardiobacterium hominis TaxID=2718 RepID=UPI0028E5F753|nr:RAQPRD family integrative conjugative element protein [Cardiobacterium hominis]
MSKNTLSFPRIRRRRTFALLLAPFVAATALAAGKQKKTASVPLRSEQAEIESVLREIEYVRERVQALQGKYGQVTGNAKIRFNYAALIEQLRTTEGGIREFLNARIDVITTTPPQPLKSDLSRVRPN